MRFKRFKILANKRRTGISLYGDIVLFRAEWNYFEHELKEITITAFEVLCFLYDKVLVQSRPFVVCRLPYDHMTQPWKIWRGLSVLTKAGLITKIKNGKYQFNEKGDAFIKSFQMMTAVRRTKLLAPLKKPGSVSV